jgi:glycosyltransferase involved in cell wall biosynthesis
MKTVNPQKIEKAEIVVGIPSYNEEETIDFVVEQASLGLEKYFPDKESVIINADNHSADETKEVFFKAKGSVPRIYISTAEGVKGKGYNFYNLFLMIKKLKAKVGIVLDADLRSIRADWIKKMAKPVLEGYDFVSPYYIRCKTDATITNHLVYPLVYGLLGWDIRQPIGGDFAFSDKMVDVWLKQEWSETTCQFGIDIFMSLIAFLEGMKTCQVNLGSKIHNLSNPKLGPMFFQVAETLFEIISKHLAQIKDKAKVQKVVVLGGKRLPVLANTKPDEELFRKIFLDNLDSCWSLIAETVSQSVKQELAVIRQKKQGNIGLDLWTRIVYDFLSAYVGSHDPSLIKALGCLYFGRAASFFSKNGRLTPEQAEREVIKRAKYFFKKRDYFLKKIKSHKQSCKESNSRN